MSYKFSFHGGVFRRDPYTIEKFLLFWVVGGEEIHNYQMLRDSLVVRASEKNPHEFISGHKICKLFLAEQGNRVSRRHYSFYFQLLDESNPLVTIRPFDRELDFYFQGHLSFLKKSQVLKLLNKDCQSRTFLLRQEMLPIETLKRLITVDKTVLKRGVRKIRLGGKNK